MSAGVANRGGQCQVCEGHWIDGGRSAVDALMVRTFHESRDLRSEQYKQGVRAILNLRLRGIALPPLPYRLGTTEADAYFSGQDEGKQIMPQHRVGAAA